MFTLTDLHQSNIFVDNDWHITAIVDLEWACSRPIKAVNEIASNSEEYDAPVCCYETGVGKGYILVLACAYVSDGVVCHILQADPAYIDRKV